MYMTDICAYTDHNLVYLVRITCRDLVMYNSTGGSCDMFYMTIVFKRYNNQHGHTSRSNIDFGMVFRT